jgi:hypothetical protein
LQRIALRMQIKRGNKSSNENGAPDNAVLVLVPFHN